MSRLTFSSSDTLPADRSRAKSGLADLRRRADVGFMKVALDEDGWRVVEDRARTIRSIADHFAVGGIGGSSLGARALIAAAGGKMPVMLENIDPETVADNLARLPDLKRTHFLWTSKSGTTLETLTQLQIVDGLYRAAGLRLADHSTVIAEPKPGPLQDWAHAHDVPTLAIPANVGGRFSVYTAAGILPAALAGVNLNEVRRGILRADKAAATAETLIAQTLASWRREEWVTLLWTYGDRLRPLTAWLQQLWAESLAKKIARDGSPAARVSFPSCCVGSIDQHSILQQVVEGARDKWVWLLHVQSLEAAAKPLEAGLFPSLNATHGKTLDQIFGALEQGTARGLNEAGVNTFEWVWPKADAEAAGYAMFLLQLVVAGLGECLNIDAFNQPGVERGKTITQEILRK